MVYSHPSRFWQKTALQCQLMLSCTIVLIMPQYQLRMLKMPIIRHDCWHRPPFVTQWAHDICMRFSANVWQFLEVCRWVDHWRINYGDYGVTIIRGIPLECYQKDWCHRWSRRWTSRGIGEAEAWESLCPPREDPQRQSRPSLRQSLRQSLHLRTSHHRLAIKASSPVPDFSFSFLRHKKPFTVLLSFTLKQATRKNTQTRFDW